MLRQRISNLIRFIFRPESTQNSTNPIPHPNDLTNQSILSISAEKVEYQFLQYWQLNQSVLLTINELMMNSRTKCPINILSFNIR
ncbi:hypothetical protein BpHYR1_010015 [Brachionus plicatilis]|uniref:Uncharacterized protein n=1 Tax=Brachionus plicatilis TaxID=10195 RepID=A0A3M7QFI3_BRAPC|nr:hypothetical protein BpHYR1_010015 [Brachionus plicatilis]